jgi:hypothetical protein
VRQPAFEEVLVELRSAGFLLATTLGRKQFFANSETVNSLHCHFIPLVIASDVIEILRKSELRRRFAATHE